MHVDEAARQRILSCTATAHGALYRGQVHHPPYQVRGADVEGLDESLLAAAGLARPAEPPLALFSAGVDVEHEPQRP